MDDNGLPEVGDVFLTATLIFVDGDHAAQRPVVVVRRAHTALDYITVVQRSTTAKTQTGIDHPRDLNLGIDKDGRWVLDYARAVRCDQFLASATHTGRLAEAYLEPLIKIWEQS